MFKFNMAALAAYLKKQSEQGTKASYYNIDILKYQVIILVYLFFFFSRDIETRPYGLSLILFFDTFVFRVSFVLKEKCFNRGNFYFASEILLFQAKFTLNEVTF